MGGFKPVPLDQLPIPQAAPPTQYTPAKIDEPPSQQPPGAGSMGAGGKIADVASNFLTGWLKGKQQAEQKKLAMAQQNMEGLHYGFQIAQQNAAQVMNDPKATPEAKQQAEAARQAAWKAYLDGAEPYTAQPKGAGKSGGGGKGGQGNGIKDHLKQAFGAEDPHIFSQGAMALLRTTGPPSLPQKSSADQYADLQLARQQKIDAAIDHLADLHSKGASPEEIAKAEENVRTIQGQTQTPKEKLDNALASSMSDYMSGKPINPQAKEALEAQGYIPKPVMPDVFLQADEKGQLYAVSIDKATGKATKGSAPIMKTRLPPDARQETQQIFEENLKQLGTMLKQAHPDWTDEQIKQSQAQAMLSGKFGIKVARGMSPAQSQTSVAKALNEVYNTMLTPEEKTNADKILTRTQGVGGGGYMFRKDVAERGGLGGWWDNRDLFGLGEKKKGGMTAKEADDIDQKVRNYTRLVMRDKMGLDQDQVDALVPQSMQEDRLKLGMEPTPDANAGSKGVASMENIQEYAQLHNISVEEAKKQIAAEGFTVSDK